MREPPVMAGTWVRMETPLEATGSVDERPIGPIHVCAVWRAPEAAAMRLFTNMVSFRGRPRPRACRYRRKRPKRL